MRVPLRNTTISRFLLPGGLLGVATLASLAMVFPGATADASGHADASQVSINPTHVTTRACGTVNVKGVTNAVPNAGNPFLSNSKTCLNGHLITYGNTAITYANPPQSFISAGTSALRPDLLELPRQRRQRRRSRRPGHHRAEPAGRRAPPRSTSG